MCPRTHMCHHGWPSQLLQAPTAAPEMVRMRRSSPGSQCRFPPAKRRCMVTSPSNRVFGSKVLQTSVKQLSHSHSGPFWLQMPTDLQSGWYGATSASMALGSVISGRWGLGAGLSQSNKPNCSIVLYKVLPQLGIHKNSTRQIKHIALAPFYGLESHGIEKCSDLPKLIELEDGTVQTRSQVHVSKPGYKGAAQCAEKLYCRGVLAL